MNVYENKDWSVFKYKEQPISVNPELLSEYKLPDYPNDNVFVTNGYAARLQTAFQFLVKKCGGGKLHVDEKSKF